MPDVSIDGRVGFVDAASAAARELAPIRPAKRVPSDRVERPGRGAPGGVHAPSPSRAGIAPQARRGHHVPDGQSSSGHSRTCRLVSARASVCRSGRTRPDRMACKLCLRIPISLAACVFDHPRAAIAVRRR